MVSGRVIPFEGKRTMDGQGLEISSRDGAVIFRVRVQPRASRDEIAGVIAGALK